MLRMGKCNIASSVVAGESTHGHTDHIIYPPGGMYGGGGFGGGFGGGYPPGYPGGGYPGGGFPPGPAGFMAPAGVVQGYASGHYDAHGQFVYDYPAADCGTVLGKLFFVFIAAWLFLVCFLRAYKAFRMQRILSEFHARNKKAPSPKRVISIVERGGGSKLGVRKSSDTKNKRSNSSTKVTETGQRKSSRVLVHEVDKLAELGDKKPSVSDIFRSDSSSDRKNWKHEVFFLSAQFAELHKNGLLIDHNAYLDYLARPSRSRPRRRSRSDRLERDEEGSSVRSYSRRSSATSAERESSAGGASSAGDPREGTSGEQGRETAMSVLDFVEQDDVAKREAKSWFD